MKRNIRSLRVGDKLYFGVTCEWRGIKAGKIYEVVSACGDFTRDSIAVKTEAWDAGAFISLPAMNRLKAKLVK